MQPLRGHERSREGAGRPPALLLDRGQPPSSHRAREGERGLRLVKQPGGICRVVLLFWGFVFCCLGVLLFLPAVSTDAPSAFAGARVDRGDNAPSAPYGSHPLPPAEEVQESVKVPVNAHLLTMLLLTVASSGASVLWRLTNARRRRGAIYSWGVDDRAGWAAAREGPSFLGVFRT
jgi:hypothetical protein